jgi:hypothetical protein
LIQKLVDAISLNCNFCKGKEPAVAASALACEGIVLICWEHRIIHNILNSHEHKIPVPKQWSDDRYDGGWIFDLASSGKKYLLNPIPQLLLAGNTSI